MTRVLAFVMAFLCLVVGPFLLLWSLLLFLAYSLKLTNSDRARQAALAWDQLINALSGGDHREYLSTRAAIAERDGKQWGCFLCGFLDSLQPNHCDESLRHEPKDKQ